jgi:isopentenyl phosphate kinase
MRTIILKLGGSIVTQKHRVGVYIRRQLLARIAKECAEALSKNDNLRLIIVHGAGSAGHQLADKYGLKDGTKGDPLKLYGSLLTQVADQKLNLQINELFIKNGLMVTPIHTASFIIQNDKAITNKNFDVIDCALELKCIPIMYGEMVFDEKLGMSVCSGDSITMLLANKYNATKIIFASDIDGIFNKDPHKHNDAKMIKNTTIASMMSDKKIKLSGSHNVDVTGGLQNKIAVLANSVTSPALKSVVVCNGLKKGIITKALSGESVGTTINI